MKKWNHLLNQPLHVVPIQRRIELSAHIFIDTGTARTVHTLFFIRKIGQSAEKKIVFHSM